MTTRRALLHSALISTALGVAPAGLFAAQSKRRFKLKFVSRQILAHYRAHPAIIGYQIDNETTAYGAGTLTYAGTHLSDALQRKVLEEVLQLGGLTGSDQQLPSSIRVRHGTNGAGRRMHYYLNYSGEPQTFTYSHATGTELLAGTKVPASMQVTVPAWDLLIIEEGRTRR